MKRRDFIAGLCGATALWPVAGEADRARRIGVLLHLPEGSMDAQVRLITFRLALTMLGWIESDNITVDLRLTGGNAELAARHAAELAAANPDILISGNAAMSLALQRATRTIPTVFTEVIDPVGQGLVADLAHPGGNITGVMMFDTPFAAKWLELLRAIKPDLTHVMVIHDPAERSSKGFLAAIERAAPAGMQLSPAAVSGGSDIAEVFDSARDIAGLGAIALPGAIVTQRRKEIVTRAAERRIPIVSGLREDTAGGGLASYGVNATDLYRQAASYVDRILRGETPAELPVQAAARQELVVNLATATALGLALPPALLDRADQVIK